MKKHLSLILATLCCTTVLAQLQQAPTHRQLPKPETLAQSGAHRIPAKSQNRVTLKPVTTTVVYDQPEGKRVVASENSTGLFPYYGYEIDQATDHRGMTYIDADSCIWIEAPFTQYYEDDTYAVGKQGWLRLDKTTTGYTLKLPQAIIDGTDGVTYYATRMTGSTDDYDYKASTTQTVSFTVSSTGVISQKTSSGTEFIGITDKSGNWLGYGDYGYSFAPNYDTPVTYPADLQTQKYVWTNKITAEGSTFDQFVAVAIQGNDVYFQNVADSSQYFHGTIQGDKCLVPNDQYLGLSEANGYIYYVRACKFSWRTATSDNAKTYSYEFLPNDATIEMNYDASTGTFSMPEGEALCINIDNADDYFQYLSPDLRLYPFVETPATPVTPYVYLPESYYRDYAWNSSYGMGYGSVEAVISPHDTDGNYLDPGKMYYRMYIDDEAEPYVFSSLDYEGLPADSLTEMPLTFSSYDIYQYSSSLRLIFTYSDVARRIGFQAVYYGGGECHESEIGWYSPTHELADESSFSDTQTTFGSNKLENYNVAVALTDPSLVGSRVTKVTIPFSDVTGLTNGRLFLTTELKDAKRQNVADILTQSFDIKKGNVEVTLAEPYTIPEGGIYVGYSFDETALNKTPLSVINKGSEGNFYLMTSRTYLHWSDQSMRMGLSTAMKVTLENDMAAAASVSFEGATTKLGDKPKVTLTVSNHGSNPIKNIDYTYTEGSLTGTKHIAFPTAIPAELGASATTTLTLPAQVDAGNIPLVITITDVNGEPNQDPSPSASAIMKVYSFIPTYRPLMEEYTGTGCGWCPRGLVGLDKMEQLYGYDFCAVSYHQYNDEDAMYFAEDFSNSVSGFPSAFFNRNHSTDAYYGDSNTGAFGLDATYESVKNGVIPPADVWAEAHYTDADSHEISATASASFPLSDADAHYAFALFAIGNNMSGTGSGWVQSNYYSGGSYPADLQEYVKASGYYTKQVYNFVCLAWTNSTYVKNSLPKSVEADVQYDYTAKLDLSGKSSIIKDPSQVDVVVAMIDTTDGHVVNANRVKVLSQEEYTGIDETQTQSSPVVATYSLDGKRLSHPQRGINLLRHADGTTTKLLIK